LVALAADLLDRQIVHAEGIKTVRVSDLVLACMIDEILLVGADASIRTLLRRAGTGLMRRRVATRRVYDWAALDAISRPTPADGTAMLPLAQPLTGSRHPRDNRSTQR
jgi:hypothetical protein